MTRRDWMAMALAATAAPLGGGWADDRDQPTILDGAIVRGPSTRKQLGLIFSADGFAESAPAILDALARIQAPASFFLTGRFLRNPDHEPILRRLVDAGHDLGPHSDAHLLYASWDRPPKLLVSRETFLKDLQANDEALRAHGVRTADFPYFLPPYEHYTPEIGDWTRDAGRILINFTPGTRSQADYMPDDDPAFVPADRIVRSILEVADRPPDGLNGYLLLMHLGSGPKRTRDHLADHLPALLDHLCERGYRFERLGTLLA
jgi:peptidoglycan/xylan/chitin deacetylase (PgdA/CDA1 family)